MLDLADGGHISAAAVAAVVVVLVEVVDAVEELSLQLRCCRHCRCR